MEQCSQRLTVQLPVKEGVYYALAGSQWFLLLIEEEGMLKNEGVEKGSTTKNGGGRRDP